MLKTSVFILGSLTAINTWALPLDGGISAGGPNSAPYLESIQNLRAVMDAPIDSILGHTGTVSAIQFSEQTSNESGTELRKTFKVISSPGMDGSSNCALVTLLFSRQGGTDPHLPPTGFELVSNTVKPCPSASPTANETFEDRVRATGLLGKSYLSQEKILSKGSFQAGAKRMSMSATLSGSAESFSLETDFVSKDASVAPSFILSVKGSQEKSGDLKLDEVSLKSVH